MRSKLGAAISVHLSNLLLYPLNLLWRLSHLNLTQVHRGDFDRDISEVGEELRLQRMRCQLQIYTPPLAHCTSLKPEAARRGSISVPAHTGYIGPPTLIYLSCLSERLFPPRERWGPTRFTHVYEMKFILGKAHALPLTEKNPFCSRLHSLHRYVSPPYTLPPFPE